MVEGAEAGCLRHGWSGSLQIDGHDDVEEVVAGFEEAGLVGAFEFEDDLALGDDAEGLGDELGVEADVDVLALVAGELDGDGGFADFWRAAGEFELFGLALEAQADAAGLFVGQQGGALDGGAEDGFVEGGLLVLVARDDVFEGGEGAFDEAGGECGAGAFAGGFRAADGEDSLGLGDGNRDGFIDVVGELQIGRASCRERV